MGQKFDWTQRCVLSPKGGDKFILDHSDFLKDGQTGDPKASQAAHQRLFSSSATPTPSDTHPTPTGASFLLAENLWLCKFADLGEEVSQYLSNHHFLTALTSDPC